MSTETLMDAMKAENDFCSVCLRTKSEVKLSPISTKMYDMFFVGFVKCVESKWPSREICVWCSRRVSNALKLVETVRTVDRILGYVTQTGQEFEQIVCDQIETIKRTHVLTSKVSDVVSCDVAPGAGTALSVKLEREDRGSDGEEDSCLKGGMSEGDSDGKDATGPGTRDFLALKLHVPKKEDESKATLDITKKTPRLTEPRKRNAKLKAATKKKIKKIETEKGPVDPEGPRNSASEVGNVIGGVSKSESRDIEARDGVENSDTKSADAQTYTREDALKYIRLSRLTEEERLKELEERKSEARYRNSEFRCESCGIGFVFRCAYDAHMERHSQSFGSYMCSICGVYVRKVGAYRQHCRNHYARHACTVCGFNSPNRNAVLEHYLSLHTKQRHTCEHCGSDFSKASGLKKHMKLIHNVERPVFHCPRCSQTLSSRFLYNLHVAGHSRAQNALRSPHKCNRCERAFRTASYLRQHLATHSSETSIACQLCGVGFKSQYTLYSHVKRKHSAASFECDYCRKTFTLKSDLRAHIVWIHERQGFYCKFCSKVLRSPYRLGQHVKRKHEGWVEPRDKLCEVCGKGFSGNSILQIHRRIHSTERAYRCTDCPASLKKEAAH